MVVNEITKEVLHPLTKKGKERYCKYLEDEATKILEEAEFKRKHPIKWICRKILEKLKNDEE